jgi:NCAIR mutase (PurE)-related protein
VSEFQLDWQRAERTGVVEAVLCDGKTAAQIDAIITAAGERRLLLTRLSPEKLVELPVPQQRALDYDPRSCTAFLGPHPAPHSTGVGIVCAGTSDTQAAYEAQRTLAFHGHDAPVIADVGVAGLWRLMRRLEEIRAFRVVIAAAGMEGALFSVLAGLVEAPVIAVPTSVGYGVGAGGHAALQTALASCAPGLLAVNIDNGFGAACAAIKIMRSATLTKSPPDRSGYSY